MPNSFFDALSEITPLILKDPINYGELLPALKELKALFLKASHLDASDEQNRKDIHHNTGKAIGPEWAALCIDDFMRTKRFITGTYKAIQSALKNKNGTAVTLLYVGTGPFATLVMPLLTLFKPEELQLVLVEVNPISVLSLKNCIKNFGVEAYIKKIYTTDAAQLQMENTDAIDILLLECMQNALANEPQVAITYNILPQLRKDVILVPEEISLSISLVDSKKKMDFMTSTIPVKRDSYYKNLQNVFTLNKEAIATTDKKSKELVFPKMVTELSEADKSNYNSLVIATHITVFDDQKLDVDECSLTLMYKIDTMEKAAPFNGISSQYVVNENPGLKISFLE